MPPRADNPYENWTITFDGEEETPVARLNNEPIHGTLNNEVVENVFTGTVDDDGDATYTAATTITADGGLYTAHDDVNTHTINTQQWITTGSPNTWTTPNTEINVNTDWLRDALNATTYSWDYAYSLDTIESVEEIKKKRNEFKNNDRVRIRENVLLELLERIEELEELNSKLEKYADAELAEEWERVMKSES